MQIKLDMSNKVRKLKQGMHSSGESSQKGFMLFNEWTKPEKKKSKLSVRGLVKKIIINCRLSDREGHHNFQKDIFTMQMIFDKRRQKYSIFFNDTKNSI